MRPRLRVVALVWTALLALPAAAAAAPTITSGPSGDTADNTPTFTYQEALHGFNCSIDLSPPNEPCGTNSGSYTSVPLQPGPHVFRVESFNILGQSNGVSSRSFNVLDITPPDTVIDARPPDITNDTTPTWTFHSTEPTGATFECRLTQTAGSTGSGSFSACNSGSFTPSTLPNTSGAPYLFEVRAKDQANNTDGTPATDSFTLDTSAPAAPTITDSDPDSPSGDNNPEVKGSAEAGSTVLLYKSNSCGGAATGSPTPAAQFASPGITVNVPDDSQTQITARATDQAGNVSPCSAAFTYVEDTGAPDTVIDTRPADPTNDTTPTWTFHSTEPTGATFECRLTQTAGSSGSGAFTACDSGTFTQSPALSNTPGAPYLFEVRAKDQAGNQDLSAATDTFTLDTSAPAAPAITDTDPDSPSSDNSPEVKGSAEAGSTVLLYKSNSCGGAATGSPTPAAQFASPGITVGVSDGSTQITARATDQAGNVSPCSAAFTYVADSGAPDTVIDTRPADPTNDTTPTWTFHSTEPTGATFECRLTQTAGPTGSGSFSACNSGSFTPSTLPNASGAPYLFEVQARDQSNNTDATPATDTFTLDTSPPSANITATPQNLTNDTTPTWTFNSPDGGTGFDCRLTAGSSGSGSFSACNSGTFTPATLPNSPSQDYFFEVRASDAAGNQGAATTDSFTLDTSAPAAPTGLTTDPPSPANDESPRVKGTAEAGSTVRVFTSSACGGSSVSGSAADFAGAGIELSVPDNSTTDFTATATDQAGNASSCSTAISYTDQPDAPGDTTPPDTTITAAPAALIRSRTPSFAFEASESGVTYECRLDSDQFSSCSSPFTTPSLKDGTHTFQVRARDAAQNADPSPASAAFRVDGTAPTARITKAPKKPGRKGHKSAKLTSFKGSKGTSFSFTADESEVTFECRVDSGGYSPCTSPHKIAGIPNGKHIFRVRATDLVGNVGTPVKAKFVFRRKKSGQSGPPIPNPPDVDPCAVEPTIVGTDFDEVLTGTAGDDVINAKGGNDRVDGGPGNDLICAGQGDDDANGGAGNDLVATGSGNDQVSGGDGDDSLLGDEGDDRIEGGAGNDLMYGSTGSDFLIGGAGSDFLDAGLGNDKCDGGSDKDSGIGCERATPF